MLENLAGMLEEIASPVLANVHRQLYLKVATSCKNMWTRLALASFLYETYFWELRKTFGQGFNLRVFFTKRIFGSRQIVGQGELEILHAIPKKTTKFQ